MKNGDMTLVVNQAAETVLKNEDKDSVCLVFNFTKKNYIIF